MRIARFTTGADPLYGVVAGEVDEFGQAADDSVVVELSGDPMYVGVKPTQTEHRLADVRLLAPVIPRSKVVAVGRPVAAWPAAVLIGLGVVVVLRSDQDADADLVDPGGLLT